MSWALNPDWSEFYVGSKEIWEYFNNAAQKFGLNRYIKLRHRVVGAVWEETRGVWLVDVVDEATGTKFTDWCHFLVNGTGFLNHWRWPDIPGLDSFKGTKLHSAAWDESVVLKGKRVAVIGNGSSGIQIVTAIQPEVKALSVFIRSPSWVSTSFAQDFAGPNGTNFSYTDEQKQTFRSDMQRLQSYRKAIETNMNSNHKVAHTNSPEQQIAVQYLTKIMKSRIGENHPLADRLIPDFGVGCRRPTPGVGYLEALVASNNRIFFDPIAEVVEDGIKLNTGESIEVDIIVCATGFDVSWKPRFPVIGRGGIDLSDQWKDRPLSYLSFAVPNFPNFFIYLGPNSPLSHGSALPSIEHLTKYLIRLLHKIQIERYKAVEPKLQAMHDFIEHADAYLKRTVWSTKCRSWLKGGKDDGPPLVHPGSRVHWFHMLMEPRWEDWEWTSRSTNRFAYLGNGFSSLEEEGRDKAWYIDEDEGKGYEAVIY
ncbi:uncharacterized protein A1O5_12646 [Cladophialophora psammophila CBS 110553]|uniref:Uncharacterized protein n=1 Tax=Cladophialophora psammophila CBS 110553 TaxID=1182543 RepID=W9WCY3_9EURO|nr:uncharacterized protein A1O5_12646 [Cladophialophora psammophila CBS 110553]EXJ56379.1 hypothetical protein A1O5_12646 [Cladophialophora psammophila CBS 110553]